MGKNIASTVSLPENCSIQDAYLCIFQEVQNKIKKVKKIENKRKLYYVSAEFLIGKMLVNNLLNLGIYEEVETALLERGFTMDDLQNMEVEPSLGNGGLGRLAACFLDSIANLNLCGDGIGLYYHFGLFAQSFENNKQVEKKDSWINETSWVRKTTKTYPVYLGNIGVLSRMYDMDILGQAKGKNTLHLFDIESVDENMVGDGIHFDKRDMERNLTLFLYPDDSDEAGRLLRIYQQYFMVSSGAQYILEEFLAQGHDLLHLHEHVCIQINDTHPTLIIPELIRLLMQHGITMRKAIEIISKTCAYTNHTILAEALETWPRAYLKKVVPQLMSIIEALDALVAWKSNDARCAIIDDNDCVHMAHLDIHYGYSINGVAKLHTDILKQSELKPFYELYPEKFNNKTNGISFRRFLHGSNRELTTYLSTLLGKEFLCDAMQLEKLLKYEHNEEVLQTLVDIKHKKKEDFTKYMKIQQGVQLNTDAIFDVQIKRLHEYKRQQMNALYIIRKYLDIKKGILPKRPILFIFGAKAAPAYVTAKDIIHVILCLQEIINQDMEVKKHIQICFIENYNVSKAEKLIPAADLSEQISLASKEASGTGNMKLMVNGAVTIGTMDGANVEIAELVKEDNIYIFGESSESVIDHYKNQDYCSKEYYDRDEQLRETIDFMIGEEMCAVGDELCLQRYYKELLNKDYFMTLLDLEAYTRCKEQAFKDYENKAAWAKKMLINIAKSGYFSSDRTIQEYANDIWKL